MDQNDSLIFSLVSKKHKFSIGFQNQGVSSLAYLELMLIFSREIKEGDDVEINVFSLNIDALQTVTPEIKEMINEYVDKYKESNPRINKLNDVFKNLADNESILILNSELTMSSLEELEVIEFLEQHDGQDKQTSSIEQERYEKFKIFLQNYELYSTSSNSNSYFGEIDRTNRKCRYCGKSMPDVRFKKKAHTVSEALGNKSIVTRDECDDCNQYFGAEVEPHVIEYLNIFRSFHGIHAKKGIPKLEGKNYRMSYLKDRNLAVIGYFSPDGKPLDIRKDMIPLKSRNMIKMINVYKSLVKYCLGILPNNILENFGDTISWARYDSVIDGIPKVGVLLTNRALMNPQVTVYIRKNTNTELPYAIGEFHFASLVFLFIIPTSCCNKFHFISNGIETDIWKMLLQSKVTGWKFEDFSSSVPRDFILNLRFEQKQ